MDKKLEGIVLSPSIIRGGGQLRVDLVYVCRNSGIDGVRRRMKGLFWSRNGSEWELVGSVEKRADGMEFPCQLTSPTVYCAVFLHNSIKIITNRILLRTTPEKLEDEQMNIYSTHRCAVSS